MSQNSYPILSARCSPTRSPSPCLSNQRQSLLDDFPSPASANYSSPHSSANVVTRDFSPPQPSQEYSSAWQGSSHLRYLAQGSFSHAHDFTITNPVFIDNSTPTDNFMEKLLQHTIIGAEFDSSDRDPPPRCHPATRLAIIQRCLDFALECDGKEKLRWVVGPAGAGKSAVMQMVVEKVPDGVIFASVFLSVNGRRDASRTIITIAYQLAVRCEPYGQFIRNEITRDPSLIRKSLSVHFERFIVKPFIHLRLFDPSRRFLIAIDGLDECDNILAQQNLLELISNFCISYPTSPIAWIIASRPEPHITSFFDKVEVRPAYIKEEMEVDSDEACQDVQRYLRDELNRIKLAYSSLRHKRQWPSEHEFTKIASAAGGLFAYASTVVRHIDDPRYRDPSAQLRRVLETIDGISQVNVSGRDHPMAQLDALYARILLNIPDDVMIHTRKILLLYFNFPSSWNPRSFRLQCNVLGLTEDAAYGAISYLHAVVKVPEHEKADDESLEFFHKSFKDFLCDFKRSGIWHNRHQEVYQMMTGAVLKVVEEVSLDSDGFVSGDGIDCNMFGRLRGGPRVCDDISLSWPGDERFRRTDEELRHDLYSGSMSRLCSHFHLDHTFYSSMSCFQALATRFYVLGRNFPISQLRRFVFDKCRHELMALGELKQVSLRSLDNASICGVIELRFVSPNNTDVNLSRNTWKSSCYHAKWEPVDSQHWQEWDTAFDISCKRYPETDDESDTPLDSPDATDIPRLDIAMIKPCHEKLIRVPSLLQCDYCSRRLARHFINNPDQLADVFVDSTGLAYVEFSFVDPDDGVSEWRYRFCHSGPPKPIDV